MPEHYLNKIGKKWECSVCKWSWKSKPSSICPGKPRYDYSCRPDNLLTEVELHKLNLKPNPDCGIAGVIIFRKNQITCLYDKDLAIVDNPDLPPIYEWDNLGDLTTAGKLKKLNLSVDNVKPRGVAWVWDSDERWGKWIDLYHPDDCVWKAKDSFITKSNLKASYALSDSWIERIGKPDKLVENPHHKKFKPMKLYSRQRVEKFLADNAEDYARWLDRRDRYIAIFEANKDKILEGAKLARETKEQQKDMMKIQTQRCLQCAYGAAYPGGFLCTLYPSGLEFDKMPCQQWESRN